MKSLFPDAGTMNFAAEKTCFSNTHVILLVDDHEIIRHGVRGIITRLLAGDGEVEILEASTFAEANRIVLERRHHLELIVLDLSLLDTSAMEMARYLESEWADLPVVVVSASEDWALVARFIRAGVLGFVPKSSNVDVIRNALQVIFSGGRYFPCQVSVALAEENQGLAAPSVLAESESGAPGFSSPPVRLSPRQEEILYLMFKGRSNKEISNYLDITLGTVKNHVAAILHAFNVNSRSKAVMAAIRGGFKEPLSATGDEISPHSPLSEPVVAKGDENLR